MNKHKLVWVNFITAIMVVLTIFWVYPAAFIEAHPFVFSCMSALLVIVYAVNIFTALDGRLDVAVAGYCYLLMMEFCILLHHGSPNSVVLIGYSIGVSLLFSVGLFLLLKWDKKKATELEHAYQETQEECEETETETDTKDAIVYDMVSFDHPDFDFVLETIQKDVVLLSHHTALFDVEEWHEAKKIYANLQQAAMHYQKMRPMQRLEAEAHVEALCIHAEEYVEQLKQRIDDAHLMQIKKLASLHIK